MKKPRSLLFLLLVALLLSSCHRSLVDPFVPKDVKQKTQFRFSSKQNRTVQKHLGFARKNGRFNDSFSSSKRGGSGGGFGKDSYSSRPKKGSGGGFSRDSYSSRQKKGSGGGFSRDSYSSRQKKGSGGGFSRDSYSSRQKKGSGGGFSRDSYSSRSKKRSGGGFSRDSYSSRSKKRTGGGFSHDSYSSRSHEKTGGGFANDSYSSRHKRYQGAFSFNTQKKRVSPRFSLIKRKDSEAGSFGHGKRPRFSRQYVFNEKTKSVKKRDSIWWDISQSFKRKKYKKKKMELELFDPNMKRKLNIGK